MYSDVADEGPASPTESYTEDHFNERRREFDESYAFADGDYDDEYESADGSPSAFRSGYGDPYCNGPCCCGKNMEERRVARCDNEDVHYGESEEIVYRVQANVVFHGASYGAGNRHGRFKCVEILSKVRSISDEIEVEESGEVESGKGDNESMDLLKEAMLECDIRDGDDMNNNIDNSNIDYDVFMDSGTNEGNGMMLIDDVGMLVDVDDIDVQVIRDDRVVVTDAEVVQVVDLMEVNECMCKVLDGCGESVGDVGESERESGSVSGGKSWMMDDNFLCDFSDMDTCMDACVDDAETMCAMEEVFGKCLQNVGCDSVHEGVTEGKSACCFVCGTDLLGGTCDCVDEMIML